MLAELRLDAVKVRDALPVTDVDEDDVATVLILTQLVALRLDEGGAEGDAVCVGSAPLGVTVADAR